MTAEEVLEEYFPTPENHPDTLRIMAAMDAWGDIQWNAALDDAAENTELTLFDCFGKEWKKVVVGKHYSINDGTYLEVDKQSILKLKK